MLYLMNKARKYWEENAIYNGTVLMNPIQLMGAYHQSRVNAISDEEIESCLIREVGKVEFLNYVIGAQWFKNKLLKE